MAQTERAVNKGPAKLRLESFFFFAKNHSKNDFSEFINNFVSEGKFGRGLESNEISAIDTNYTNPHWLQETWRSCPDIFPCALVR